LTKEEKEAGIVSLVNNSKPGNSADYLTARIARDRPIPCRERGALGEARSTAWEQERSEGQEG